MLNIINEDHTMLYNVSIALGLNVKQMSTYTK